MAGAVVLSAFLFFGCGGQNKQKTEKEMNADTIKTVCTRVTLQKDSLLATLTLDSMKVTWIRDNASSRLMPRTLFPDCDRCADEQPFSSRGYTSFRQHVFD